jgi:hypothetical protein
VDSDYSYGDGYTCVTIADEGGEFRAPLADYKRLVTAWEAGESFLHFTTVHGSKVVAKAARVSTIMEVTAESLARWIELRKEEDQQRALGE